MDGKLSPFSAPGSGRMCLVVNANVCDRGFGWSRDEQFMRDLVVRLKGKYGSRSEPWRCEKVYCERYHEHDGWAPRTGTAPCRDYT